MEGLSRRVRGSRRLLDAVLVPLTLLLGLRLTGQERGPLPVLLVGALPVVLTLAWPVLVLAAVARLPARAGVALGLVLGQAVLLAPAVGAAPLTAADRAAPGLRVVTANLYVGNRTPEQAGRALLAEHPDVLVVPELTPASLAGLRAAGLDAALPHAAYALAGRPETLGLFSRLPLADVVLRRVGTRVLPRATVRVGSRAVRLVTVHTLPPLPGWEGLWRAGLADLAAESRAVDLPLVVAGDLNATRDHAALRAVLATGLRDAGDLRGQTLAASWPAGLPLLQLDHVLVRDGRGAVLLPRSVRRVPVPGSDHAAVVVDVAVRAR